MNFYVFASISDVDDEIETILIKCTLIFSSLKFQVEYFYHTILVFFKRGDFKPF